MDAGGTGGCGAADCLFATVAGFFSGGAMLADGLDEEQPASRPIIRENAAITENLMGKKRIMRSSIVFFRRYFLPLHRCPNGTVHGSVG